MAEDLTADEKLALEMLDANDRWEQYTWVELLDAYRLGRDYGRYGWLIHPKEDPLD